MKKATLFLTLILLSLASFAQVDYQVIPLPQHIDSPAKAGAYLLQAGATISYPAGNDQMQRNAAFLNEYLGHKFRIQEAGKKRTEVRLSLGLQNSNPDAYLIKVDKQGILIQGATESGVFRGIQTLRKSVGTHLSDSLTFPFVTIQDQPRFQYRGAMLDCARHYFPVQFLKEYLDILALHGVNNWHWHITDDQGWRFEVKAMPELAKQGSIRQQTVIGHNCGIYDGQEYGRGCYYTQEECREIVAYAAERYINVIPEIDLPGHMVAALSVYPELGCTGGPYDVWSIWGVSEDVLCVGNPKTLEFLHTVLGELMDVFPSKYIHIGGDESPRNRWKACPKCQAKMRELGLTKEAELQTYVNKDIDAFLTARGRNLIGWDETLEGGLSENAIVMSWRGYDGGVAAAKQHHRAIMSPNSHCYIDYYQAKNTQNQPLAIGGYLPISKVYSMEPIPAELNEEEAKYIIGAQCNLWTEYVIAPQQAEYMLLPRLAAMSEVQWCQPETKDFTQFQERLKTIKALYRKLGYRFCPYVE